MDFVSIGITVIMGLQILTLTTLLNHQKRINRIENDMYVDPKNPVSNPLTKQMSDVINDIKDLKSKIDCLEGKIETLISIVEDIKNRR